MIHQENKVNGFGGFGKVDMDKFLRDFAIAKHRIKNNKENHIPVNKWQLLSIKNIYRSYSNLYYKSIKKRLGVYKYK